MTKPTAHALAKRIRRAEAITDWQRNLVRELKRHGYNQAAARAERLIVDYKEELDELHAARAELSPSERMPTAGNIVTVDCGVCSERYEMMLVPSDRLERGQHLCACGTELSAWEGPYRLEFEREDELEEDTSADAASFS